MNIRQAVQEYLDAKRPLSRATQKGYRRRLMLFVAWCEERGLQLEALTARHIRRRIGPEFGISLPDIMALLAATSTKVLMVPIVNQEVSAGIAPAMVES